MSDILSKFNRHRKFVDRHLGPTAKETADLLKYLNESSAEDLASKAVPKGIRLTRLLCLPKAATEVEALSHLKSIAKKNKIWRTYIGSGYNGTIVPQVIQRNILENPGWYTQYTPYQAEIAQGRLESLLNFQTMISDLTGLPIANASLLDESTAAAEAMAMLFNNKNKDHVHIKAPRFFVDENIFMQTKSVLMTRSKPIGIELVFGDFNSIQLDETYFGAIVQYPDQHGLVNDYRAFIEHAHASNVEVVMATDLLALALLTSPGELGADVAIGNAQRFGVPMGFGGPHAAFFATKEDYKRNIPGRIIGISVDADDNRCLRMALQTREQHIRREKATSNICTAQALLANMSAMYAVYHGPEGIKNIAKRTSLLAATLSSELAEMGFQNRNTYYFDTVYLTITDTDTLKSIAASREMNFAYHDGAVSISLDETTTQEDVLDILHVFATFIKFKVTEIYTGNPVTAPAKFTGPLKLEVPATFRLFCKCKTEAIETFPEKYAV
jgi:glycine dehydrogenase